MSEIYFEIPGEPKGKARARTVRLKNGMSRTYTPDETVSYENFIKLCFREAAGPEHCPEAGLFRIEVDAFFSPPKTKPKAWVELALIDKAIRPQKKPDWDNIGKIVADALNGIAFQDDSMVVDGRVRKWFSNRPRVEVIITDMTDIRDSWSRK